MPCGVLEQKDIREDEGNLDELWTLVNNSGSIMVQ